MVEILSGKKRPTVAMSTPSNAPREIVHIVKEVTELRGADGENGADGKDGRNAFPDGLVAISVGYTGVTGRRYRNTATVIQSNLSDFVAGEMLDLNGPIQFADGRSYRVTVAGELGNSFVPVGTRIAVVTGAFDLRGYIPEMLELPDFLSRLPAFNLVAHVEFQTDDA